MPRHLNLTSDGLPNNLCIIYY